MILNFTLKSISKLFQSDKNQHNNFRGEYEKLFNALEKSHRNEKRLNTKCHELGSEIASKQAQVDAATDKTLEDQDTISSLKKEIEKAWKMVDMTQEREERARETIETLNTEIQNLTKVIEEKTLGAEDTNLVTLKNNILIVLFKQKPLLFVS